MLRRTKYSLDIHRKAVLRVMQIAEGKSQAPNGSICLPRYLFSKISRINQFPSRAAPLRNASPRAENVGNTKRNTKER